ncbi:MAG TPA: FtsW/RodA/SpoVE family cell cycle protein [Ignavibacteriaceae bacterium]|nr:FtsW/RodA/SpoVE family cell cycle protein [Ignavibacteriaceae bacterium]
MKKLALTIFLDAFVLTLLGLVLVMSASSTYSAFKFDSLFHLFNSHFFKVIAGISLMVIFAMIPYEIYKEFSKMVLISAVVLLVITYLIAPDIKGAGRWINLGFMTFQPADFARLALVVHLAALIESKGKEIEDFKHGFVYLFIWVIMVAALIFIQPNLSNGILVLIISLTILFVGGAKLKHILGSIGICTLFGGAGAMIFSHSRERILTFIHSFSTGGDINLQVKQALLGLGSGGILGVGMGHSRQSNLFLPEAYGDFIFAILGEELGFIGSVIVLFAYLVLFVAGILIAKKCKDVFGQLLAFGISVSVLVNAFINVAVATGLVPTTGLPLPFISYGGTSLIFMCISTGILVNIGMSNAMVQNKNINQAASDMRIN